MIYIYIYGIVSLRASVLSPFRSSWIRTLLGGLWNVHNSYETCTTSMERAQLLWNVRNSYETCATSMIYIGSQTLQKALNDTIPTYVYLPKLSHKLLFDETNLQVWPRSVGLPHGKTMGFFAMPRFFQDSDKPYAARYVGSMVSVTWWNPFRSSLMFFEGFLHGI